MLGHSFELEIVMPSPVHSKCLVINLEIQKKILYFKRHFWLETAVCNWQDTITVSREKCCIFYAFKVGSHKVTSDLTQIKKLIFSLTQILLQIKWRITCDIL